MSSPFQRLSSITALCVCALAILIFNTNAFSQDLDEVTISGKITDGNGAALPGAIVTALLIDNNQERTAAADSEGRYRIIELKPGKYIVRVNASGFAVVEQPDLNPLSGDNLQLNYALTPAGVRAETVVVDEDSSSPVDTTRTIVGGTVTQREIEELPNVDRNPLNLVFTLGGVAEEALSTRDLAEDRNANARSTPFEQGLFSLSGGAAYSNNVTIDGLDNNDDRSAGDRFQPSLESVAEVQVIRNQFSAEYGRASGGRINLRTKAGTNNFRGRAFMFFRDDNLNANTYYNKLTFFSADGTVLRAPLPRQPLTEYNPGFTLNGPIILPFGEGKSIYNGRDRTFFSVAYEYNKLDDTTLVDTYVPLVANSRFALPASTGGSPNCDNTNPAACTGNQPTAGFIVPYNLTLPTPNTNNALTARIDHKLFKNNDITFGLQYGRRSNLRQGGAATTRIEDALQARNSNTEAFNITDNQVFGANAVNQFRAQYSRFKPSFQTDNPSAPVVLIAYRDPITNGGRTLTAGNSTASTLQNFSSNRNETRYQFQETLSYVAGNHSLKSGFDVQRIDSAALDLDEATGTFNFGSVLQYQNNQLNRFRQNFGTGNKVTNTYYGIFLNDETKLFPNFTVNYGVRYERETAISDNNNFGPRLGIAWDPFNKGKGVIRFGAGIFYNRVLLRTVGDFVQNRGDGRVEFDTSTIGTGATDNRRVAILNAISGKFPNGYASIAELRATAVAACATVPNPLAPCTPNLGFAANVSAAGNPLRSIDPNLRIPESYQFNLGFEREIGKGFVFEANYTWNKTSSLWREFNPNVPVLPTGFKDFTAFLLANPFVLRNGSGAAVRTYNFVLGATSDGSGVSAATGGNCVVASPVCTVNLNTVNTNPPNPPEVAVAGTNTNSVGNPIGIALAAVARLRPDQTVAETARVASIGNAFYQGLVLEVRSRFRKLGYGFSSSFRGAYTLSKSQDDGLNNTTNAEINTDFSREFVRNTQDRRHRLAISGVFDTPYWLAKLRFSPLYRYGSSAPFNVGIGSDRNLNDQSTDRLNFSGNVKDIKFRQPGSPFPDALISQFSLQPIGAVSGNLPRNAGTGPSFFTFDLSVTREFRFTERIKLRPTAQFDNVLNSTVFSFGSEFINLNAISASPTLNQRTTFQNVLVPTRTFRQRQIRLGFRFDF